MDILSDVNISGNLKTSGSISILGQYGSYVTIEADHDDVYIRCLKTVRLEVICGLTQCGGSPVNLYGDVFFKGVVDFSEATLTGLPDSHCFTMNIPTNCTKFFISDFCFYINSPVPVYSYMKDGSIWKNIQLDVSFNEDDCSFKMVGSISTPFSEEKTLHFILG